MTIKQFWTDLDPSRKAGFAAGAVAIVALTAAIAQWALAVDYKPVLTNASPDRLASAVREIDKLKIPYRIAEDGTTLEVPTSQLGKVRMGVASGSVGGANVGFEIFNNTDFSTTDFTQKVNYQRALQGELARTISSMEGITGARVHLVLAESGFMRRAPVNATAAVTVGLQPGVQLGIEQVRGIQRLVAATVPDIKLKDIAILDQRGEALTKNTTGQDSEPGTRQLALKREVDTYLEGKLRHLLANLDPDGEFNVSVDATLNQDEVKVTTENVLPLDDGSGSRTAGVLVKERQSQRQDSVGAGNDVGGAASAPSSGSLSRETEYRVGRRVEQVASVPGNIERISVAIVARIGPGMQDERRIRDLVISAVGMNSDRGDSVAVVFLPLLSPGGASDHPHNGQQTTSSELAPATASSLIPVLMGGVLLSGALALGFLLRHRRKRAGISAQGTEPTDEEIDDIVGQVRAWLDEGKAHASQ